MKVVCVAMAGWMLLTASASAQAICGPAKAKFGSLGFGTCAPVNGVIAARNRDGSCAGGVFGASRNGARTHEGLDLLADKLTDVYAAREGTVIDKRSYKKTLGTGVAVEHHDGTISRYAHLNDIDASVEAGQAVSAGQLLGRSGVSGNAEKTACPHLHLQVQKQAYPPTAKQGYTYGAPIDPLPWLLVPGTPFAANASSEVQ